MSSAYGTREGGRRERIPVTGSLYWAVVFVDGWMAECCVAGSPGAAVVFALRLEDCKGGLSLKVGRW